MSDDRLIGLAHQMADTAGEILRRYWRSPLVVGHKSDATPVTIADREVEAAMRALVESHYPEHGIIGEEYDTVRPESEFQWVLDPIDGTRSFIGGYPLFTTLIALAYRGIPIVGIIDQPISGERWLGIAGKQTTLNGKAVSARPCHALTDAVLATTSIDYFTPVQLQSFQNLRKQCANTVLGGDAYAYAMLASGHNDMVVDAGLKPYDFCALKPVLEGAGAIFSGWQGEDITLACDGRVIAAATPQLHSGAITSLTAVA